MYSFYFSGSLAFFVSACSQHNTENNDTEKNDVDVVATPATATNLPAGDPKGGSETGESDNDSVTTTANGKSSPAGTDPVVEPEDSVTELTGASGGQPEAATPSEVDIRSSDERIQGKKILPLKKSSPAGTVTPSVAPESNLTETPLR
jgi:hypothetical protein